MDRLIVDVRIRTEAPLSIAMPVAEYSRANQWNNFPVMARGLDEAGTLLRTGFLPATTVRGALRRGMVLPIMEAMAADGNGMSLRAAYENLIGQNAESEKGAEDDEYFDIAAIAREREDKPVVDLMGSGLGFRSRMKVSNFLPKVNILPEAFSGVRKDLGDTEGVIDILEPEGREEYLLREKANSKRSQADRLVEDLKKKVRKAEAKDDEVAALKAELAAAEKLLARHSGEMGAMKVSSRTLVSHFALPMGIELSGRVVIDRFRDRDMALLMSGLDYLSRNPVLGAHSARGAGEISGIAELRLNDSLVRIVKFGGYKPVEIVELGALAKSE